jgi:hypothetical protein
MDHNRVQIRTSGISCGVMELSGITDPEGALYQIAGRLYHPSRGDPVAFLIASDVYSQDTNTHKLATLFLEKKLGSIVYSEPSENPKTGNAISVCVININHTAFKKWYSDERVNRIKKVGT